jgi:apolipoprotein N-acyltransferase
MSLTRIQLMLAGGGLTGLLLFALFPPLGWALLAPLAPLPLLYAMAHEPDWRYRALAGWLAGAMAWGGTCYWIRATLENYGGLNFTLSVLAIILFALAKGLHLAVFAALAGPFLARPWGGLAAAALWVGLERTHGPLGFTWLVLGNAGLNLPLPLRLAPYVGVYGLSFVFVVLSGALLFVLLRRPRRHLLFALPLALLWLLPAVRFDAPPVAEAVTVQPALADNAIHNAADNQRIISRLALMTLQAANDPARATPHLLLWPEIPAPFYYYDDPVFRADMTELARSAGVPIIFGTVGHTPEGRPLNSAVQLARDGRLSGRYDKRFLVPFGEFVPPLFGWINKVSSEAGDFAPGDKIATFLIGDHMAGPFICYEAAFPHLVREVAAAGAQVFVNLSNDGYFGRSAAREQHLLLARMRAVENHRWLLRSTNDGISVSIDPLGRVWDRLPNYKQTAGRLRFGWSSQLTPYTRNGDWFAWLSLAGALVLCWVEWLRAR